MQMKPFVEIPSVYKSKHPHGVTCLAQDPLGKDVSPKPCPLLHVNAALNYQQSNQLKQLDLSSFELQPNYKGFLYSHMDTVSMLIDANPHVKK